MSTSPPSQYEPASSSSPAFQAPIALSNREEDDMRKKARETALKHCDEFVKAFADCATGRTVTVAWACRGEYKVLLDCMRPISGEAVMQDRRREYLLEKRAREADKARAV